MNRATHEPLPVLRPDTNRHPLRLRLQASAATFCAADSAADAEEQGGGAVPPEEVAAWAKTAATLSAAAGEERTRARACALGCVIRFQPVDLSALSQERSPVAVLSKLGAGAGRRR